jgi:hypothetical protein
MVGFARSNGASAVELSRLLSLQPRGHGTLVCCKVNTSSTMRRWIDQLDFRVRVILAILVVLTTIAVISLQA